MAEGGGMHHGGPPRAIRAAPWAAAGPRAPGAESRAASQLRRPKNARELAMMRELPSRRPLAPAGRCVSAAGAEPPSAREGWRLAGVLARPLCAWRKLALPAHRDGHTEPQPLVLEPYYSSCTPPPAEASSPGGGALACSEFPRKLHGGVVVLRLTSDGRRNGLSSA